MEQYIVKPKKIREQVDKAYEMLGEFGLSTKRGVTNEELEEILEDLVNEGKSWELEEITDIWFNSKTGAIMYRQPEHIRDWDRIVQGVSVDQLLCKHMDGKTYLESRNIMVKIRYMKAIEKIKYWGKGNLARTRITKAGVRKQIDLIYDRLGSRGGLYTQQGMSELGYQMLTEDFLGTQLTIFISTETEVHWKPSTNKIKIGYLEDKIGYQKLFDGIVLRNLLTKRNGKIYLISKEEATTKLYGTYQKIIKEKLG